MKDMYKLLSLRNDVKALFKGRIMNRIWNKVVMKKGMSILRRLMK